jgi:CO/xanthine dehydrogenase FAD-binding subunit
MYSQLRVFSPQRLEDALKILAERGRDLKVVAGSTDVSVQLRNGVLREKALLNISKIDELKYVKLEGNTLRIGSLCTFSYCIDNPLIKKYAPILREAFLKVGSVQIRNMGTIGGNLGTASPAGDSIPPLYVLEARVLLESLSSKREVPVEEFFKGPKLTAKRHDELIVEVRFKVMERGELYFFRKLGLREANAISVASVATILKPLGDGTYDPRIALGAVGPTVFRAIRAEGLLRGKRLTEERIREAAKAAMQEARAMSDIRGSAKYRRRAVAAMLYQGLYDILLGYGKEVT